MSDRRFILRPVHVSQFGTAGTNRERAGLRRASAAGSVWLGSEGAETFCHWSRSVQVTLVSCER